MSNIYIGPSLMFLLVLQFPFTCQRYVSHHHLSRELITIPHFGYVLPSGGSLKRLLSTFQCLLPLCSYKHLEPHLPSIFLAFSISKKSLWWDIEELTVVPEVLSIPPIRRPTAFYKRTVVQGWAGQMAEPAERVSAINALNTVNVRWLFFFSFWKLKYIWEVLVQTTDSVKY